MENTIANKINLFESHFYPLKARRFGGSSLLQSLKKSTWKTFRILPSSLLHYPWDTFHQFSNEISTKNSQKENTSNTCKLYNRRNFLLGERRTGRNCN